MTRFAWIVLLGALAAGCAGTGSVDIPTDVPELRPGILQGYLPPEALPDSAALLPPPPEPESAAMARDREAMEAALALQGTPRWEQARADAVLRFPAAVRSFSCALGAPITEEATPNLYMLLRRSLADLGLSTYGAKNRYRRTRPFMVNEQPTCTPDDEEALRADGSYPSGHAAIGWGWALILAELAPERADALLARGRDFAESRVICNVHWSSDVAEGRNVGAAAVARLHGDPVFRAQLEQARGEVADAPAGGATQDVDCAADEAATGG
ncbi:MAG TPA: phosphatase PAP2 family protein [Pseudomonadales bacterium]